MSESKTTEKLVRKCFSFCFYKNYGLCNNCVHPRFIARAARRFVRMEQAEKEIKAIDAKTIRWRKPTKTVNGRILW